MNRNLNSLKALNEDNLEKVAGGAMTYAVHCDTCGKEIMGGEREIEEEIYSDTFGQMICCKECYEKLHGKNS